MRAKGLEDCTIFVERTGRTRGLRLSDVVRKSQGTGRRTMPDGMTILSRMANCKLRAPGPALPICRSGEGGLFVVMIPQLNPTLSRKTSPASVLSLMGKIHWGRFIEGVHELRFLTLPIGPQERLRAPAKPKSSGYLHPPHRRASVSL